MAGFYDQCASDIDFYHLLTEHLGGVKVLHGLDKVLEGGAVVLTLKDQSILADGDINEGIIFIVLSLIAFVSLRFSSSFHPVGYILDSDFLR